MKGIILTADDFGACDFIDNGIYDGIRHEKINTVSAFVTHEDSVSRIENLIKLREEGFSFKIGLHFSLTSGISLLQKESSLTSKSEKERFFFQEAKNYPFKRIKTDDFQQELFAQLKQLDEVLGDENIDHISCHHGVINFDAKLYSAFLEIVDHHYEHRKEKYSKKISVRSPQPWSRSKYKEKIIYPIHVEGTKLGFWKKLPEAIKFRQKYKATLEKTFTPHFLIDTIYGRPQKVDFESLFNRIHSDELACEFMFHLGSGENNLTEIHGIDLKYFEQRKEELKILKSINFPFSNTFSELSGSIHSKTNEIS